MQDRMTTLDEKVMDLQNSQESLNVRLVSIDQKIDKLLKHTMPSSHGFYSQK